METDKLGGWFRTHRSSDVKPELDGEEATVLGWVHDIRDLGGIRFILLKDKTGKVQITIPRDKANDNVLAKAEVLHKQDAIGVRGIIKKMQKAPGGAEIVPKELRILGIAKQPLPLDVSGRTPAEIDVRLNARVLDLCREENQAIFRIQHVALEATRSFLSEKGFIEVYTPRIIVSATEGGAALFPVAYFKQEAFLAQSTQLYKEQLIKHPSASKRVYFNRR
jgi:nondiscriminating aspartyl-tRNA synthetase